MVLNKSKHNKKMLSKNVNKQKCQCEKYSYLTYIEVKYHKQQQQLNKNDLRTKNNIKLSVK